MNGTTSSVASILQRIGVTAFLLFVFVGPPVFGQAPASALRIPDNYHASYASTGAVFYASYPGMLPCSGAQVPPDPSCIYIYVDFRRRMSMADLIPQEYEDVKASGGRRKALEHSHLGKFEEFVIDNGSSREIWRIRRFSNGDSLVALDSVPPTSTTIVYRDFGDYFLKYSFSRRLAASVDDIDARVTDLIHQLRESKTK